ncbi:ribosomal RNA-processing protein 15 [[Candida] railenensis]|uniref:Ribosomal RNA-processing protein 15 n=1 Tax=[Candida] railenensis TaxID=45579 RepID=A0A9P0VYJ8_9ASCO|nr:ribosomal RNA-processing protein 15 [[Candida] railenensis]
MGAAYKKQKLNGGGLKKKETVKAKIEKKVESESESESDRELEVSDESRREEDDEEEDESSLENLDDIDSSDEDVEVDEDDEVDVADVSSSDDESNDEKNSDSDSDSDSDSEIPKLKKKKNLDDGSESFANAVTAIVGSRLKAYDRSNPILARSKRSLKKLESDKLEAKAKRLLNAEKKDHMDNCRVKNLLPSADQPEKVREIIEKERKLKKIAQRGVVRLFNAVLSTQVKTNQDISKEKVGLTRKNELMNEISKEKFLDLVQAAGQS